MSSIVNSNFSNWLYNLYVSKDLPVPGLDSLELLPFDQRTLHELQNMRGASQAEIILGDVCRGGVPTLVFCALTIIPGIVLMAQHLLTVFASTPVQTLVDRYVNTGKSLVVIKGQWDKDSLQVKKAEYAFNKASCEIVERIWQNGVRSRAPARNLEFLAATCDLVQRSTEKQGGDAYLRYEVERTLKKNYVLCLHCIGTDPMNHRFPYPTKPQ